MTIFRTLIEGFARSVEKNPNAEAIAQNGRRITYGELHILAGKVAAFLFEGGLKKGNRVGLLANNSPEYVAIYYGILAAGGVAVTLNTQTKARDVKNWVKHADAKWLFVDQRYPELGEIWRASRHARAVIIGSPGEPSAGGNAIWSEVVESDRKAVEVAVGPGDLASIIYTSGTTGQPKGIALTHGNLASNVCSVMQYLRLTAADSIVDVLPFYYSYGNSVLHTHLCAGGRLVLENSLLYPHLVVERIAKERATGFSGVPSTFALLLGRVKIDDYDLSSLRYLTQAGGPMAPALTQRLADAVPNARLYVMYGQTEATARLTYLPPEKLTEKKGSVGIPIPGVAVEIRDKHDRRVSEGVTGEICAQGENIMRGYWKDDKRTAEVLRDGWLHTGDLAHYDADGYIYIDGRSSDMIKTGANRISPREVEEVIQELPEVEEVAVIGVPDETLGEVIKAFVVAIPGQSLTMRAVQLHCWKNLAKYKIPKQVEFVGEVPKTASGKVKRQLLRQVR
jgi:acyl-CoA synthetase (AMP-forming)/AMP-acid ligase II